MSQHFDVRTSVLYENRYCGQNDFNIIINHEGYQNKDSSNSIIQIESGNVKFNVVLIPTSASRFYTKTAVIGSDIFVFNGSDKKVSKTCSDDVRSKSTWKNLMPMPDSRRYFSVCSFMNSIYI